MNDLGSRDILKSALAWLDLGAALLPIQPNSKSYVYGYGPNKKQVKSPPEAAKVWGKGSRFNLAIYTPPGLLAFDFDDAEVLLSWQDQLDPYYRNTYQEQTPHGWRAFYWCNVPWRLCLIKGVEIKDACLVAPSRIDGFIYAPVDPAAPIIKVTDPIKILFSLLSEEKKHIQQVRPAAHTTNSGDVITRIKAAYPVAELAGRYTELKPSGRGERRWMVGLCPFHKDHNPSFWVDNERQLWGCFACDIRGDVINFYARIHGTSLQAAIRALAGGLRE